ncbi:hypothetical protein SUDANB66_00049 [Streptomyces sp. SudanB66_2053]
MPNMNDPVARASGLVRVEYHMFYLAEGTQDEQPPFRPENGLIFSAPGRAVVLAGINSGSVRTTVEVYQNPIARAHTEEWDEVVDHSVQALSGRMKVASLMDDSPAWPTLTPFGPGHYRVRLHARGRDRAYDGHLAEAEEEYLLQIWPSQPEPDTVHKQSDQAGAGFRQTALQEPLREPAPPPVGQARSQALERLRRRHT